MFQTLSLTKELDISINKCKEIEKSIIASYGKNHGVQNDILKDCIKLPCWRKYGNGNDNVYIFGLSCDSYDVYWFGCTDINISNINTTPISSFPNYCFRFITCLDDVLNNYPELGSHIKEWTDEEKKLLHDDTIKFFKNFSVDRNDPNCNDRLLYLSV